MSSIPFFLVGASTFSLPTITGKSIGQEIGIALSNDSRVYSKNALEISEIPREIVSQLYSSKIVIMHLGIMDFLPKLSKRYYPLLAVQSKTGFLYDVTLKHHHLIAKILNTYNRYFFNKQLNLTIGVSELRDQAFTDFLTELITSDKSQVEKIFLITPPPIRHPGWQTAIYKFDLALESISESTECLVIINYSQVCFGLFHDISGHLQIECRKMFVNRILTKIVKDLI